MKKGLITLLAASTVFAYAQTYTPAHQTAVQKARHASLMRRLKLAHALKSKVHREVFFHPVEAFIVSRHGVIHYLAGKQVKKKGKR